MESEQVESRGDSKLSGVTETFPKKYFMPPNPSENPNWLTIIHFYTSCWQQLSPQKQAIDEIAGMLQKMMGWWK